jgi:hypothetical protein
MVTGSSCTGDFPVTFDYNLELKANRAPMLLLVGLFPPPPPMVLLVSGEKVADSRMVD